MNGSMEGNLFFQKSAMSEYSLEQESESNPEVHFVEKQLPGDGKCIRLGTEDVKGWDVFVTSPKAEEDRTKASSCYIVFIKAVKTVTVLIAFLIVLGSTLISRSIPLIITGYLNKGKHYSTNNGTTLNIIESSEMVNNRVAWLWSLILIVITPDVLAFLRCLRFSIFKSWQKPTKDVVIFVFLVETLHSLATSLLFFVILPSVDILHGIPISGSLFFIPNLLNTLRLPKDHTKRIIHLVMSVISITSHIFILIFWSAMDTPLNSKVSFPVLTTLFCLIASSVNYAENFVHQQSCIPFNAYFLNVKSSLKKSRYSIYLFSSIWKICLVFAVAFLTQRDENVTLKTFFPNWANLLNHKESSDLPCGQDKEDEMYIMFLCGLQLVTAWLSYAVSKFSCRICVQLIGFSLPMALSFPVTLSLFGTTCFNQTLGKSDYVISILPNSVPLEGPAAMFWTTHECYVWALVCLLTFISFIWTTIHLWSPTNERLATTETLFTVPMYFGPLTDISLALSRRRETKNEIDLDNVTSVSSNKKSLDGVVQSLDKVTRIYACATMWHETADEMMQMLKSIMRMDEDQSARYCAQKYLKFTDPDFYQFENPSLSHKMTSFLLLAHIFFDDAFERTEGRSGKQRINQFAKQFIKVIDEAASTVHQITLKLRPPSVTHTPYGGRLEWVLPGKSKLFLHLKDKFKIRNRKRWSQVMYMYFLLGHRLMELPIHVSRKAARAENTYILALDGDIVFEPHAVMLLVDLMKKNPNLGAACGRVHPVGSGPIVWYQKFEYAISHWLQKASEHVFGCVLCSPGCFSLFRARALMSDNVLRKYATVSTEPLHFLQYDQGEDRWLSTLLLQSGYRVEYNAASDAYTHCPEGFVEFFNQRRRWGPSTLANNVELLKDYKHVIAVNADISFPYIIYQCVLMIGTILSPGAILLMLVGAVNAVFEVPTTYALIYNLVPVVIFALVCFTTKNETQQSVAQILSAGYAFLMLAVLVGTAIQFTQQLLSPSTVFFVALILAFTLTALLHPREFSCFFPLPLYILCIPSMYMFLFIYSLININVISWGTRELVDEPRRRRSPKSKEAEADEIGLRKLLDNKSKNNIRRDKGGIFFQFANLFTCVLCSGSNEDEKPSDEQILLLQMEESIKDLSLKVSSFLDDVSQGAYSASKRVLEGNNDSVSSEEYKEKEEHFSIRIDDKAELNRAESLQNAESSPDGRPEWADGLPCGVVRVSKLKDVEHSFWMDLIEKYLFPMEENRVGEDRAAYGLKDLRNRVVFSIFMLNGIFILTIFLLQMHKEALAIRLPSEMNWQMKGEISKTSVDRQINENPNSIEPVASSFIVIFGGILILQVIGMLIHRFTTFTHIMAFLKLNYFKKTDVDEDFQKEDRVQIVKDLQSLKGIDEDGIVHDMTADAHRTLERQNTVFNLERRKTQKQKTITLDAAFRKRFMSIHRSQSNNGTNLGANQRHLHL